MGLFRGKRKKGLSLTTKKNYVKNKFKRNECESQLNTSTRETRSSHVITSTPCKKKRKRMVACSRKRNAFRSPVYKKSRVLSPIVPVYSESETSLSTPRKHLDFEGVKRSSNSADHSYSVGHESDGLDETFLYSEGNSSISSLVDVDMCSKPVTIEGEVCESTLSNNTSKEGSAISYFSETMKDMNVNTADETSQDLFSDAMKILKENNVDSEIVTFLKLVSQRKFPLDNVAFQLFLDVVKWYDSEDVRSIRYSDTSMKYFWLGKRLFGGRFLRFMGGPKNETSLLQGNTQLSPSSSKINFACPSNHVLSQFNPLGYELSFDSGPGLIEPMIDMVAEKTTQQVSYVLMFDGKKIKRGADMDLLGFEKEPVSERKLKFDAEIQEVSNALKKAQHIDMLTDNCKTVDTILTTELLQETLKCSIIVSRYLMELRQMRKTKEMALVKYKERIAKDPALAKTLQYAMDSCRTAAYLIDNNVASLLDVQFVLCKTGAHINGSLKCFPTRKGEN